MVQQLMLEDPMVKVKGDSGGWRRYGTGVKTLLEVSGVKDAVELKNPRNGEQG
jgi:hypothetical protein